MTCRTRSVVLWTLVVGLLLPGCGSGPKGSGGGGGGGGGTVTSAQRTAVLTGGQAKWQSLIDAGTARGTRETQMAAWLAARPGVAASGVSPGGDIWARFADGQYYLVLDGSNPAAGTALPLRSVAPAPPARAVRPVTVPTRSRRRAAGDEGVVPESKQARMLLGMGPGFPTQDDTIERLLQHAGYDVIRRAASIENYRAVANDGVFFLYTHGGIGGDGQGHTWWNLWTTNKITEANDQLYAADLADGSLVRGTAIEDVVNNQWVMGTHYLITQKFITKYAWSFAKGAFIMLNACHSYESGACASVVACPGSPGAAVGWTATMETYRGEIAAAYLFDRMLGTNEYYAQVLPQRPMIASEAIANVNRAHYSDGPSIGDATYDPAHPAALQEAKAEGDPVLAPSIKKMVMHERSFEQPTHGATKLHLIGWFGDQQGKVTVGGTEVPVSEWARDHIDCQPADQPGAGFSGDVQAVTTDQRDGNMVPLTHWHGKATYDVDLLPHAATAHSRITMDVYLRGDAHQFRDSGGGPMIDADPIAWRATKGSTARWAVSGSPPSPATWTGPTTADLPFGLNGNTNPPYGTGYIFSGTIDTHFGTALFSFNFLDCVAAYVLPSTPAVGLATNHDQSLTSQPTGIDQTDGATIFATNLADTIDTSYVIPGKTLRGQTVFNATLKFDDFLPTNQPIVAKGEDDR